MNSNSRHLLSLPNQESKYNESKIAENIWISYFH